MSGQADYGAIFGDEDDMDDKADIIGDYDYTEEQNNESDSDDDMLIQRTDTGLKNTPKTQQAGHPSRDQHSLPKRSCPSPPWGRKGSRKQATRVSKPRVGRRKPLTTDEKIEAALQTKNKSEKNTNKYVQRARTIPKVTKATKKKESSVLDFMALQEDGCSSIKSLNKKSEDSVLNRPTERTKNLEIIKKNMKLSYNPNNVAATGLTNFHAPEMATGDAFQLMKLKKEIRLRIWTYCVIHRGSFIRPNSKTGAEQPDLAMTCRQIRAEVLPIYYGCNDFAIDVTPALECTFNTGMYRLEAINKWMDVLEKGGHFSKIRNWVFCYMPEPLTVIAARPTVEVDEKTAFVAVSFESENALWKANAVEVHHDARCLTSPTANRGTCILKKQPDWLNNAVVDILHKAGRDTIKPGMIQMLANSIKENAPELSTAGCTRVVKSIECDSTSVMVLK